MLRVPGLGDVMTATPVNAQTAVVAMESGAQPAVNRDSPNAVITRLLTIYCLPVAAIAYVLPSTIWQPVVDVVRKNCGETNMAMSDSGGKIPCPLIWAAVGATALYYGIWKLTFGRKTT